MFNPEEAEFEEAQNALKDNLSRVAANNGIEKDDFVEVSSGSLIQSRSWCGLGEEEGKGVQTIEFRVHVAVPGGDGDGEGVIRVEVDLMDDRGEVGDRTGSVVWPCSSNLSSYLTQPSVLSTFPPSHTVLEICSGSAALPSQFLSLLTSAQVTASETPETLSALIKNLRLNSTSLSINCVLYSVGDVDASLPKYDTVIGCECVYDSINLNVLASSCKRLTKKRVMIAGSSQCRLSAGSWDSVVEAFREEGFEHYETVTLDADGEYICHIYNLL
ncbi:hypothetical protein TrST_g8575 [Triparma strigata]|uniref:Uncharacterized protein n=1 Tax=Triparma strigata TaxID=1606541 RepID=A0A9W6ZBB1_9STRA|nr:hypothetical protein TrST_g8575 [Triparma strigata]